MTYWNSTTSAGTRHYRTLAFSTTVAMMALLPGCGSFSKYQDGAPSKVLDWDKIPNAEPRAEALSRTGNPESYVVNGKRYFVDFDSKEFSQQGVASWYGTKFHGRKTSSGEIYDMYKMTAAHKTLPLPSYVKVTNLHNDKQIIVRVNDRGPFVDGRIIDLSYAAAHKLEIVGNGTANVAIEKVFSNSELIEENRQPPIDNPVESSLDSKTTFSVYYVQIGAFSQRIRAEQLRQKLDTQAITPVTITNANQSSQNLYRVRVGPFTDKQQMRNVESRLSELGYDQSYIILE